ncbi:ABC transporter ATP-binding protein [Corynebacterium sp. CCM 8862]|uniref:ABC transporter ATP-binding protein n=2 Tax=Corynebacterium mendelii TaxID=2765362 RepID=A0A939E134_9CORY|nr:ABC transporter ATP-binding protein [Corynebacterium mendelii]
MSVTRGQVHGFLGPNGAGKSTTIRVLLGLLHPDRGTVRVLGCDPRQHPEVLARVGYVPGEVALWPKLTGRETLTALARLRGTPVDTARQRELIELFDLDVDRPCRTYSTGNKRKVLLVAALSAGAELLILDEPTAGLDPLMEKVFTDQVRREAANGTTVLLSSHIMNEVESVCDTVTIIKQGSVVEQGSVEQLKHLSSRTISARFDGGVPAAVAELPGCVIRGSTATVTAAGTRAEDIVRLVLDHHGQQVTCTTASLEDIFLSHYEKGE